MVHREFLQSLAAPGAAIAVQIDIGTAYANTWAGDFPIRLAAAAWGGFHD